MQQQESFDGWPSNLNKKGWLGNDLDKERLTHRLNIQELDTLRKWAGCSKAAGKPLTALTMEDFSDPQLDTMLARLVREMKQGPGLVIIAGIPVESFTLDELKTIFWGIGCHFGVPVSQNSTGELMGEVRVRPSKHELRAFSKAGPLEFHTDRIDMLALFSIHTAETGGATLFKSALAIWDTVARERPDILPILERGFYMNRGNEYPEGEEPITSYRVPIFATKDGVRSCLFSSNALLHFQKTLIPGSLTQAEEEALIFVNELRVRPESSFSLLLQPGEMVFINNYELLHGRDDFTNGDTPETQRFLLRLWLQGRPWRPKPDGMIAFKNKSGLQGIDPKPAAQADA